MRNRNISQVLRLALPLIAQQVCLQMQVWIDRAMLGHANAVFFSAIGNTLIPYHMLTSTVLAICGGTAILVAQGVGAGNSKQIRKSAESSFLGSTVLATLCFLFLLLCSDRLFQFMGVRGEVLEYSTQYMRILSVSLLILGPSATANSILQGLGFTRIIMATGVAGNFLNIVLDWVLIFGKLGAPAMGIRGAALATVIANAVSAVLMVLFVLCSSKMPVKLRPIRNLGEQLRSYRQVLTLGIPSGLEYLLWNVANMVLVSFLNRLNMMAAGIYTLVFSIESVPLLVYMGFANAGLTLVGQGTGAKDPGKVRQSGLMCLGFSVWVCVAVAVVFHVFPRQLLTLFTDDAGIVGESVRYLRFISWIMFPKAINNVIGLCIRGMGDTRWMLYTQIFGTVFLLGAGYYLILRTELGLMGIFVTFLADESIRGAANMVRFLHKSRVPEKRKVEL